MPKVINNSAFIRALKFFIFFISLTLVLSFLSKLEGLLLTLLTDCITVRLLREELQLLQESGSYVGEVVKAMDKKKVLVKVCLSNISVLLVVRYSAQ